MSSEPTSSKPGTRTPWPTLLLWVAAVLLCSSGFLFYTLILEEQPYIQTELEDVVISAAPAVVGLPLAIVAGMLMTRRRRTGG